jgi:hypothetical protein
VAAEPRTLQCNRSYSSPPLDGLTMNTGRYRINYLWLPGILIAGLGAWMLAVYAGHTAEPKQVATTIATEPSQSPPVDAKPTVGMAKDEREGSALADPVTGTAEAITSVETAPIDGLKIASQSWRRGGLGSNAMVTFTLHNTNDYAVKDVELFCSFSRRDGSHLTDRRRMLPDVISMRSRKTFARLHVGFVNINADQAKCSLIAASHA